MPYFSFSISNTKNIDFKIFGNEVKQIKNNTKYFSKNTKIWKMLQKTKYRKFLNFVKIEKREKISKITKKILFFLPPSIGLGDAVEYAISIKAILKNKNYEHYGIAFVDKYKLIFEKYFKLYNLYENIVSEEVIKSYDTHFHFTLEIPELINQKYDRSDIEYHITKYFFVGKFREIKIDTPKNKQKNITIFPISKSPIRTMSFSLINSIINNFEKYFDIDIVLDKSSEISNYIEKKINFKNINILYPENLENLLFVIENMKFGIFIDSGPLHIAKILNKKGVLVTTSVNQKILLNGFPNIIGIDNNYQSKFCSSPCGLTNIFNFKNNIGCYDSMKKNKNEIINNSNLKDLQRGSLKNKYVNFIINPVNCIKNIKDKEIIDIIETNLMKQKI